MSKKTPYYYWDSCVFIDALQPSNPPDYTKYSMLREYLDDLKHSKIQIITSSIAYTEVYKNGVLDEMRKLKDLQIIDPTQIITIKAAIIRDNTGLKTPDAIHLATALYAGAEVFHTYDGKILKGSYIPDCHQIIGVRS